MMISLQGNPTLAIRLGPSRLYKIAHPRNLLRSKLCSPYSDWTTDHAITESDQRVISLTPPLFFLRPKQLGRHGGIIQLLGGYTY
jgi:hypothetical protein